MWTSAMNVGMVESWFYVMDALLPIIKTVWGWTVCLLVTGIVRIVSYSNQLQLGMDIG